MKTSFLKIFAVITLIATTSCADKAKEAETKEAEAAAVAEDAAINYNVNTDTSMIEWTGFKPTGSHNGAIAISRGNIQVKDNAIESGKFTFDMNSITVIDIPVEKEGNAKLAGHLKGADFFDVETYPISKFEVTSIETVDGITMLSGNLTMKDATNNISFPVSTEMKDDLMMLTSDTFTIDRSKWNVKHGSKSFFDNLGDKFINDDIELKVTLVANKG
ncbi:YceI family protein [Winogradskyella sp. UBA3174]|uniref:YceI family protein n=1 Tax=Winogradskyella sp. UBA3174 TaxID=1947785 RepID=UPI0025DB2544|nr:YceI family protein [Winogradskyella sp. UBA3174]|tara:strand:+ start:81724 stop:82377 length:654 start_codon:yes stop_codon:yes gene_type:complete